MSLLLLILTSSCRFAESVNCRLPCQLGINQTDPPIVQDFLDVLLEHGWIQDDPERIVEAQYAPDTFSGVLETTTSIELDGTAPQIYGSEMNLYIFNVGTVELHQSLVPSQQIQAIRVKTNIPIPISWLLFGLPEGGMVLPFYRPSIMCPDSRNYIAYHDNGNTIIQGRVRQPILINMWITPVDIMYPLGEALEFSSWWEGRFDRMDDPCT